MAVLLANRLLSLLLPAIVLVAWEVACSLAWLDPLFLPPPSAIGRAGLHLAANGTLPRAMMATLTRAATGFLPGALVGVALGAVTGLSPTVRRMTEPSLAALYSMPKLALFPVVLLLLGVGESSRLALIALAAAIGMAMQVFDGVRAIDPAYLELATNYGASPGFRLRKVIFPAVLPSVFTGARITFGRSLVVAISAEMVSGAPGLGSLIWFAWQSFAPERLLAGIAMAGVLGLATQSALRLVERRLQPWKYF